MKKYETSAEIRRLSKKKKKKKNQMEYQNKNRIIEMKNLLAGLNRIL